jgi:CubicO group peptidase (beta-lactamase class C family)
MNYTIQMKKTLYVIPMIMLSLSVFSQPIDWTTLDQYMDELDQHHQCMGGVAVSKNGNIMYTKTMGWEDVENQVKATEETKYRLGSISKTFTAVLVFQAIEQKKLRLNQTIDKWFPGIVNARKINIQHLLNHRSGIHNFTNDSLFLTYNTQPKSEKEILDIIIAGGSDFEVDRKTEYSNSNYVLLSFILQKIHRQTYADLIHRHIVEPLGLTGTYVFGDFDPGKNESISYRYLGGWKAESATDASIPLGAGAILSTPTDVTTFAHALFNGKLLKTESVHQMTTITDGFGSGLFSIPFYQYVGYGHTGGIDGFVSIFGHFPKENISFAITLNGTQINVNDLAIAVLSAVFEYPINMPKKTVYETKPEDLDAYLGVYASQQLPLKIAITTDGHSLIAQGTGQPAFGMEAVDKHTFTYKPAMATFLFNPEKKTMILKQGGGTFLFTKEVD